MVQENTPGFNNFKNGLDDILEITKREFGVGSKQHELIKLAINIMKVTLLDLKEPEDAANNPILAPIHSCLTQIQEAQGNKDEERAAIANLYNELIKIVTRYDLSQFTN